MKSCGKSRTSFSHHSQEEKNYQQIVEEGLTLKRDRKF
jgi:hypothetical protein